ncbi:PP2C family protein-serine/threonine phosphatase [Gordonia sp. VNK21]|uniref:PP2C family protein-serine/threonine phosphatase n=1 Tax=Gordonia sp. VNK21 TaxID=3382483 RepID=UPI0038D45853
MTQPAILRDTVCAGSDRIGELSIDWAVSCHVGCVRETNEDAALVLPGRYLLADGMGGHESGELASEAALLTLAGVQAGADLQTTREALSESLAAAQDRIGELPGDSARRAGTTATGVVLAQHGDEPSWVAFNIGDSRTYLYTGGRLTQVSVDHSQVQEMVDGGFLTPEQARVDPRRNVITRALGAGMSTPEADFYTFATAPGDRIVLCSDGLNGELTDAEIEFIVAAADSPEVAAEALTAAAVENGAHDNVTVVVVAVAATGE